MEQTERYPSYVVSVANALSTANQPLSVDALVDEVRGQRPISKGVRSAVYRALKQLYQAVPVAPGHYGWLSHLLRDNVFRHPLSNEEARRGFLLLDELEHAIFFPQFFQTHRADSRQLRIELFGGETLQAEAAVEKRTWSLRMGAPLAEWIDELGGQGRDDLIITVLDAHAGQYSLRLQPREVRDEDVIRDRSIAVALAAEELAADSRRGGKPIPTWELAALLIGKGLFVHPVPPDDLHLVLQLYSLLALLNGQGYMIKDPRNSDPRKSDSRKGEPRKGDLGAERSSARSSLPTGSSAAKSEPPRESSRTETPHDAYPHDGYAHDGYPHDAFSWPANEGEQDAMNYGPESFDDGADNDSCQDYEEYLEQHAAAGTGAPALSHSDYHLLEAELEMLVSLDQEFGYLLDEQQKRVDELADRLFIDPEALRNMEDDDPWSDNGGPPFWQN